MHQRRGLVIGIISLLILSIVLIEAPVLAQANWTVLVYMAGDNNLEKDAIKDMNEMETAGSSVGVNIIVQIDRIDAQNLAAYGYPETSDDKSNGDWTGARRYYITHDTPNDTIVSQQLMDLGEINMSDPNVLVDFVKWGMKTYPATHYALILWDHGGGYTGLNWDFTSRTHMSMPGLRGALATIVYDTGRKIDVIGFDMCYMASLEVDYQIAPYASVRVASQEYDPSDGWDYKVLFGGLASRPTMSPSEFSQLAVSTFYDSYSEGHDNPPDADYVTLSAVNLENYSILVSAADAFINNLRSLESSTILSAASDADFYGSPKLNLSGRFTDFIDFSDFAFQINKYSSSDMGTPLINALKSTIISEKHASFHNAPGASGKSLTGSNGISIYFPTDRIDLLYPSIVRFGENFHWVDLLSQIHDMPSEENTPLLIITSMNVTTPQEKIIIKGFTGADYIVNNQVFRNIVTVDGKAVSVNSADGTFSQEISLSCGVNNIPVNASNNKGTRTQTVIATRTCEVPKQSTIFTVNLNETMQAPARFNVLHTDALKKEAGQLLKNAKSKNLPTNDIEEIMKEAEELLKKAQGFLAGRNFIAANNFAMRACERYEQAVDILKAILI